VASNGVPTDLAKINQDARASKELSTSFAPEDRLFRDFVEYNKVSTDNRLHVRDLADMLSKDGNVRKSEQVLTLPIRGADHEVRGEGPEADFARETLGPMLGCLIDRCTSAIWARKAFFEKVWTVGDGGRIVYEKTSPGGRPPHARRCSTRRPPHRTRGVQAVDRRGQRVGVHRAEPPRVCAHPQAQGVCLHPRQAP
jgi:hypothetical protein